MEGGCGGGGAERCEDGSLSMVVGQHVLKPIATRNVRLNLKRGWGWRCAKRV